MKQILPAIWQGIQIILGFLLGYVGCLVALCLLVWAFEALQQAVR